jgi:predicted nucleic acid-binding Zn ribbon protein
MERAGEFLGNVLRRLDRPEATLAWLTSTWPAIVGGAIAAHTRPTRCHNKCLELVADGKAWQSQIETMQRQLCSRVNRAWGGNLVRELSFVSADHVGGATNGPAGPGPTRASHEMDNSHTPFIRRRRA